MRTEIFAAALAGLLLAGSARAEEPKPSPTAKQSIMTFFKHLRDSLANSAVQGERKKGRVGAVAAVRGADQKSALADPNAPVYKGGLRAKREKAAAAEDAEFAAAVDLILQNKLEDGVAALEAFKKNHPRSRNLDNVQEAITRARSLETPAPGKAPDAKPGIPKADDAKPAAPSKD